MAKRSEPARPEPEEEVTCPVCGRAVGLEVTICPGCGAEFEHEVDGQNPHAEEQAQERVKEGLAEEEDMKTETKSVSEDEMAECPVCGKAVSLTVTTCPNCGAEFEEEAIEEVIEVEEKEVPVKKPAKAAPRQPAVAAKPAPGGWSLREVFDLRIVGISLIALGIIGSQIASSIEWYWSWVPPISTNLGLFAGLPLVIIVVGILAHMLVMRTTSSGKKPSSTVSSLALSLLVFGVFAFIVMMFWSPLNSALQRSSMGVAGLFLGILIVGILLLVMGHRTTKAASA